MAGILRYTPQGGHARRAAKTAARPSTTTPRMLPVPPEDLKGEPPELSKQRNVEAVLSLGATRYMQIRNLGTFCCPPVPFQLGLRGMDLYVNMLNASREIVRTGAPEAKHAYHRHIAALAKLLHQHVRPTGFVKRKLWAIGLTRNPFLQCSEQELKDVADFFLHSRMKSSVQFLPDEAEQLA